MTTLPLMMATIATSLTVSVVTASPIADFNNDGFVNASDLITLTGSLNRSCDGECPTDLNEDGYTDTTDLMILIQQWGEVPNYVANDADQEPQATAATRDPDRDMSWQGQAPVLLDAIYYDQYTKLFSHGGYDRWHDAEVYNQGEYTQAWTQENNVEVQPMVYGGVDWDHDGSVSEEDKANFVIWLDANVPADYNGPLCLDLEGDWWPMLDTSSQTVMDVVINAYLEQLEFAKSLRPNAKIGFWGFPKKSHTKIDSTTASIDRLLEACTAIFPDVYENNPGGNDSVRLQAHIEKCLEMVNGEIPVYAQASPRYKLDSTGYRYFHDQADFLRDQVQPALDAEWTDANGLAHKVNGIGFWEAYTYVAMYTEGWSSMTMLDRKAIWNDIDQLHIEYLEGMKELVDIAAEVAEQQMQVAKETSAANNSKQTVVATQVALDAIQSTRTQQQSRLVGQIKSAQSTFASTASSFRSSAKAYRSARSSWTKARRSFSSSMRKYKQGSRQFNSAYAAYKQARKDMQEASQDYRQDRESFQTARATMNTAKEQWKSANADWQEMATAEQTLLASK